MPGSFLLTDLYQLTMLQGYLAAGMSETAVFEFFVRRLPDCRNFLVAAGLEQALDYLEGLHAEPAELDWLAASGHVDAAVIDYLRELRFTGDVDAVPEGTVVFADEPLLRVVAPLPQAQLVESRLINLLHLQMLIASKAARMVLAAPARRLIDFGFRRAHGAEAGLLAARAAYLAGFAGSATVEAERRFGVPAYGTVAHSFIQAHDDEVDAFRSFARTHPENAVLLLDTYDTVEGARRLVRLAPELAAQGIVVRGVRLDSGDLGALARRVRQVLDEGGLREVAVFASSSIDEYALRELADAPIDGYGVGTRLTTSADAPYLDCAYKLQEYAGVARRKRSAGKATWPGRKQVYRSFDADGHMAGDVLTLLQDRRDGEPMLRPVMRQGRRLEPPESLEAVRSRVAGEYARLPQRLKQLERAEPYSVEVSGALSALVRELDAAGR